MDVNLKQMYDAITCFREIDPNSYRLLGYLGYNKECEFDAHCGKWEIYTKRDFAFPYFNSKFSSPVNKFSAVYKGTDRNMLVYGSFEKNTDEIKRSLIVLSDTILKKAGKFLGVPLALTEENAQDYGYIRGVIFGILLIMSDFIYSWVFKLQEGILTSFIKYLKKVYETDYALGNAIGIAWTGMYFGIPLILLPLLYGNFCVKRASRATQKRMKKIKNLPSEYEFGIQAQKALEEELKTIIEEKKKKIIYGELIKITDKLSKDNFETLYVKIQQGFLSPDAILYFLKELKETTAETLPFEKFAEIVAKYYKVSILTELGIKPFVEKNSKTVQNPRS